MPCFSLQVPEGLLGRFAPRGGFIAVLSLSILVLGPRSAAAQGEIGSSEQEHAGTAVPVVATSAVPTSAQVAVPTSAQIAVPTHQPSSATAPQQATGLSRQGESLSADGLTRRQDLVDALHSATLGKDGATPVLDISRLPQLRDPSRPLPEALDLGTLQSRLKQGELAISRQPDRSDWLMVDPEHRSSVRSVDGTALPAGRWTEVPGWTDAADSETRPVGITLAPREVLLFDEAGADRRRVLESEAWLGSRIMVGSAESVPGPDGAPRAREIVEYGVRIVSSFTPLRWSGEAYQTDLTLALQRRDRQGESDWTPPRPLQMAFSDMGLGVELVPSTVEFERAGVAGSRTATLRYRRGPAGSADFSIAGDFDSQPFSYPAGVTLGSLRLESANPAPLGLGLEQVTLTVTRLAQDGQPWAGPEALELSVTTGRASGPTQVEIPAGASVAQFVIRTAGTGPLTIAVRAAGGEAASCELDLGLPWVLLISCLLGGLVGSLLRGSRGPRNLGLGVLVGLLAFALATLGIRVTEVDPNQALTEVGAFAITALASLVGVSVLPGAKGPKADDAPTAA
ncbi:hypothetical protein [Engelhardtia mirabilis]